MAPLQAGAVYGVVPVSAIHLQLNRANGQAAIDTIVSISADADSAFVDLTVPLLLTAPSNPPTERLVLIASLTDSTGATLFLAGPDTVDAVASGAVSPLVATMRYVGPGASAQSIVITPGATTVVGGDTLLLSAVALDGSGQPVPAAPIVWISVDTTLAVVHSITGGQVVSRSGPGTARIIGRLLNGAADTTLATVLGPPSQVVVIGGNNQVADVDAPVSSAPRVRVTDAVGALRAGIAVDFVVTAGGGAITGGTQLTDSVGEAALGSWTLGPTPTVNTIEARTQGASAGTINATASWRRRVKSFYGTNCALTAAGTVMCWGDNSSTEYGAALASQPSSPTPVPVPVSALAELADGHGLHTCGITSARSAICWGRSDFGQLGSGTITGLRTPVTVTGGHAWRQISTSILSTCGVTNSGAAYCWGSNQQGEIGSLSVPINTPSPSPVLVDGGLTFLNVAAGWLHACGVVATGEAYCWGDNRNGQLGNGTTTPQQRVPTLVAGGHRFERLSAGPNHTCGITTTKLALCWGFNGAGQLGDGTTTTQLSPTPVAGGHRFSHVAAGHDPAGTATAQLGAGHTCALTESGEPWCWGYNSSGELGNGSTITSLTPQLVVGGLRLSGLSMGGAFACGMLADAISCWGWNDHGQLGIGTTLDRNTPGLVTGGGTYSAIAISRGHACALDPAGAPWCWGDNGGGQLGDGTTDRRTSPVPVLGAPSLVALEAGQTHTCGRTSGGSIWCWGTDSQGQLGDGTASAGFAPPAQVPGVPSHAGLAAGYAHNCAWEASGVARCWGRGLSGVLGNGGTTNQPTPVLVSGGVAFAQVTAGNSHTCGINAAGGAFCWGFNSFGQLGDGSTTQRNTPVPIGAGLNFATIKAGELHSCGVTTAGAAWCWGSNAGNQLGDGVITQSRTSPVLVAGGLTFASISAGGAHTCAVTPAGAPWCWGWNGRGEIGDGSFTTRSTPTPVGGGLTFTAIRAGGSFSCGLTGAGAVYCWGSNEDGQLGNGVTPALPARVNGF